MDKIEKLLRKISEKDRQRLLKIIGNLLAAGRQEFNVKKIKSTDFYRLRSGRFRIIFHYEKIAREIVVDSIKLRNESTYK